MRVLELFDTEVKLRRFSMLPGMGRTACLPHALFTDRKCSRADTADE